MLQPNLEEPGLLEDNQHPSVPIPTFVRDPYTHIYIQCGIIDNKWRVEIIALVAETKIVEWRYRIRNPTSQGQCSSRSSRHVSLL